MCVNLWKVVKLKVPQLCLSDKYSTDYTFVNLKLWSAYDHTHKGKPDHSNKICSVHLLKKALWSKTEVAVTEGNWRLAGGA